MLRKTDERDEGEEKQETNINMVFVSSVPIYSTVHFNIDPNGRSMADLDSARRRLDRRTWS